MPTKEISEKENTRTGRGNRALTLNANVTIGKVFPGYLLISHGGHAVDPGLSKAAGQLRHLCSLQFRIRQPTSASTAMVCDCRIGT
jgi:hypothetical protein